MNIVARFSVVCLVAACGVEFTARDTDVTGDTSHSGASGGTATKPPATGGRGGDATSQAGGGSTGEGGASSGGGGSESTGGMGAGGAEPTFQVLCDGSLCNAGEVCCVNGESNAWSGCAAPGNCPVDDIGIECDGPEDCPGQICCGNHTDHYLSVRCAAPSQCVGFEPFIVMCGGAMGPDVGLCVHGGSCNASSDLPGYYYCK